MKNIVKHFNKKSNSYSQNRNKGLLTRIVQKEKREVFKLLEVKKGESILDAGCGSGDYSIIIKQLGGVPFGVDISPRMIQVCKEKGIAGVVDNLETMVLNKKFDKILCAGALEFVSDPLLAIENSCRHLKSKGIIVWLYPRKSLGGYFYRIYHLIHGINIHLFRKLDIDEIISKNKLTQIAYRSPDIIASVVKLKKMM